MEKPPKKVFIHIDLHEYYISLESGHKNRKWIDTMRNTLIDNIHAGDRIRKKGIPKLYIRKHGVTNLYRFAHPEGYRSMYTIEFREEDGLCPIILDLISHKEYEKSFGYHGLF